MKGHRQHSSSAPKLHRALPALLFLSSVSKVADYMRKVSCPGNISAFCLDRNYLSVSEKMMKWLSLGVSSSETGFFFPFPQLTSPAVLKPSSK